MNRRQEFERALLAVQRRMSNSGCSPATIRAAKQAMIEKRRTCEAQKETACQTRK